MSYIQIGQHILRDYPRVMNNSEYLVFLQFYYRSCEQMRLEVSVSQMQLTRALNLSVPTIKRAIRDLAKLGFVRVLKGHFKKDCTVYFFPARNVQDPAANHHSWNAFKESASNLPFQISRPEMEGEFA